MARLLLISAKELIKRLRRFGWQMPNPNGADISVGMVRRFLADAEIAIEDGLAAG